MTKKEMRIVQKYSDRIMELIEAIKFYNLTQDEAVGIAEAIIIKTLKEIKEE